MQSDWQRSLLKKSPMFSGGDERYQDQTGRGTALLQPFQLSGKVSSVT
jgi:hypothetical protein